MNKRVLNSESGVETDVKSLMFAMHKSENEVMDFIESSSHLSIVGETKQVPAEVGDEEPVAVEQEPAEAEPRRGFFSWDKKDTQKGVN